MLQKCGAASAGSTIKSALQNTVYAHTYITGTTNVKKKDTAKTHNNSKGHITACQANQGPTNSNTIRQLQTLNDKTETKMCKLFDIAYTVAYTEQPFSLYKTLVAVERKHGVDLGFTYHNSKSCRIFIEHIVGNIRDQLQAEKKSQPFYCSLLFDRSTDKATSDKEVISIKLIENGSPRIRLLG